MWQLLKPQGKQTQQNISYNTTEKRDTEVMWSADDTDMGLTGYHHVPLLW